MRLEHVRRGIRALLTACAVLIVLAAAMRTNPASASLRVAGRAPHAALWQRIYDQMPDVWKTRRTIVVREVSRTEMDRLVAANGDGDADANRDDDTAIDGYYQGGDVDDEAGSITLLQSLKGPAAELVFAHEYGHFVWDHKLTDEQRDEYGQLWKRQMRAGRLVTDYAKESAEEGFAEAFAHYLRKPAMLRRKDPQSLRWLDVLADDGRDPA